MTYKELYDSVSEQLARLEYEGVEAEKLLFGPDAMAALASCPHTMVRMKPTDPGYGTSSFRGIPFDTMKTDGIKFIHKQRHIPTYNVP